MKRERRKRRRKKKRKREKERRRKIQPLLEVAGFATLVAEDHEGSMVAGRRRPRRCPADLLGVRNSLVVGRSIHRLGSALHPQISLSSVEGSSSAASLALQLISS